MPAILAKKLGMTQRFTEEGRVERVTVLEAGPCPVTGIRTHEADGYEAVQLGFGAVREKALTKPELGHLKKVDAPPLRTLVEFRDFHAGPKSHGSHNVRAPGSIGASATPSRVFKGIKGPGRMGGKRVTQKGLTIVELIPDQNLMLVRGSVPGPKGGTVEVRTDG